MIVVFMYLIMSKRMSAMNALILIPIIFAVGLGFHDAKLGKMMMDGGMIQLIHNGFGGFIFRNPTDKAFRNWGIPDLGKLINKAHFFYKKAAAEVEQEMSDEDFMALYEKYPEFDDFDDAFVENEEEWTSKVAYYIDENIQQFATIV